MYKSTIVLLVASIAFLHSAVAAPSPAGEVQSLGSSSSSAASSASSQQQAVINAALSLGSGAGSGAPNKVPELNEEAAKRVPDAAKSLNEVIVSVPQTNQGVASALAVVLASLDKSSPATANIVQILQSIAGGNQVLSSFGSPVVTQVNGQIIALQPTNQGKYVVVGASQQPQPVSYIVNSRGQVVGVVRGNGKVLNSNQDPSSIDGAANGLLGNVLDGVTGILGSQSGRRDNYGPLGSVLGSDHGILGTTLFSSGSNGILGTGLLQSANGGQLLGLGLGGNLLGGGAAGGLLGGVL